MKEIKAGVRKSRIKAVVNGLQEARAPVASYRSGLGRATRVRHMATELTLTGFFYTRGCLPNCLPQRAR